MHLILTPKTATIRLTAGMTAAHHGLIAATNRFDDTRRHHAAHAHLHHPRNTRWMVLVFRPRSLAVYGQDGIAQELSLCAFTPWVNVLVGPHPCPLSTLNDVIVPCGSKRPFASRPHRQASSTSLAAPQPSHKPGVEFG